MNGKPEILERATEIQTMLIEREPSTYMKQVNRVIYDTMALAIKDVLTNNNSAPIYAIPAGTGSGKSTFTCSLICALVEASPYYTAAFVTKTIKEAQTVFDLLSSILPTSGRR